MRRPRHARAVASFSICIITAALLTGCVVNGAGPNGPQTPGVTTGMTFDEAHDEALHLLTDIQSATGLDGWRLFDDSRGSCESIDDSKPALAADIALDDAATDADAEAAADAVVALMEQRGFEVRKREVPATETDPGWEVAAGSQDGIQIVFTLSRFGGGVLLEGRCAPDPGTPAPGVPTPAGSPSSA